jgi:hypothetical protein
MKTYKYTRKQIATDIRLLTSNIEKLDENGIIKSLCLLEIDLVDTKPTKVKKIKKLSLTTPYWLITENGEVEEIDKTKFITDKINELIDAVNSLQNK